MFRLVQRIGANYFSAYRADDTRSKSLNHPRIGMFVRDVIRCLKPQAACRLKAMAWVVFRVSEYEYKVDP